MQDCEYCLPLACEKFLTLIIDIHFKPKIIDNYKKVLQLYYFSYSSLLLKPLQYVSKLLFNSFYEYLDSR